MQDLFAKLTTYNLFNYLLPGVVFALLATEFTKYTFLVPDLILGMFLYYIIGLVISRVGSLIIEPLLKWASFVKFASYEKFIFASAKDEKLEVLSEQNNMYRTFISLFFLLTLIKLYEAIEIRFPELENWADELSILVLLTLFLFAYKKQSKFIEKRIKIKNKIRKK